MNSFIRPAAGVFLGAFTGLVLLYASSISVELSLRFDYLDISTASVAGAAVFPGFIAGWIAKRRAVPAGFLAGTLAYVLPVMPELPYALVLNTSPWDVALYLLVELLQGILIFGVTNMFGAAAARYMSVRGELPR